MEALLEGEMRSEGGGCAANIYRAMPESGGGQRYGGNAFPTYGGANPVSLRSTAPSRGRGENVGRFECINPSFLWKEVPAGRRLGAQSGVKKERLKSTIYESTRAPLTRSPFLDGEGKLAATSLQNRKGDARRSLKCCLRASPHLYIAALLYFYAPHHTPEP